jgi:hypothetical protein
MKGAFRPDRVLVHPAYLLCLALLLVNDHGLKRLEWLPGLVTGKVSDLVGLVVAVGLLAALVARSRRGLWVVATAVGVLFSAINLWPSAAGLVEQLTALLGVPWQIVVDPTDLAALVVLPGAVALVARAARRTETPAVWTPSRGLVAGAAAAACLATSPPPEEVAPIYFTSEVSILNDTGREVRLRVRELRDEVELDCFEVSLDPAELLSREVFGPAQTWRMPLRSQVDPWLGRNRECHAVLLEADGMDPALVFWGDELADRQVQSPLDSGVPPDRQTVILSLDGAGRIVASDSGILDLVYPAPERQREEPSEGCALPEPERRLAWSEPVPTGTWQLSDARQGVDDCVALDLSRGGEGVDQRWYVCLPAEVFPFEVGDELVIEDVSGTSGAAPGAFEGVRLSRATEDVVDGDPALELTVSRGTGMPELYGILAGYRPQTECQGTIDVCGTYSRAGILRIEADRDVALEGAPGDTLVVDDAEGGELTVYVGFAADRFVIDPLCAELPDLGIALEAAVVYRGAEPAESGGE